MKLATSVLALALLTTAAAKAQQQPVSRAQACKELQQEYDNCVRSVASSNANAVSLAHQNNPGAGEIWLRGFKRSLVTPEAACGELKTDMWQYGCP
jgi:hypothetical protein